MNEQNNQAIIQPSQQETNIAIPSKLTDRILGLNKELKEAQEEGVKAFTNIQKDAKVLAKSILDKIPIISPFSDNSEITYKGGFSHQTNADKRTSTWQKREGKLVAPNGGQIEIATTEIIDDDENKSENNTWTKAGKYEDVTPTSILFLDPNNPSISIRLTPKELFYYELEEIRDKQGTESYWRPKTLIAQIKLNENGDEKSLTISRLESSNVDLFEEIGKKINYFQIHSKELKLPVNSLQQEVVK